MGISAMDLLRKVFDRHKVASTEMAELLEIFWDKGQH
jgi:hypothetical protein